MDGEAADPLTNSLMELRARSKVVLGLLRGCTDLNLDTDQEGTVAWSDRVSGAAGSNEQGQGLLPPPQLQLLQGPPGTGKTRTCAMVVLVRAVAMLLMEGAQRQPGEQGASGSGNNAEEVLVILAASTNSAIAELLEVNEQIALSCSLTPVQRSHTLTQQPMEFKSIACF